MKFLAGGPADPWCNRGPEGIPYYLTYLHSHPNEFSLRLLGHPVHRGSAPSDNRTRFYTSAMNLLVFKLPKHGSSVRWHRDGNAIRENHPIFNIDIYIDDSTVDNGCVWVVPKSHLWGIEEAQEVIDRGEANFEREDAVPAEVEPGDILLHHTKVLHGSKINTSGTLRSGYLLRSTDTAMEYAVQVVANGVLDTTLQTLSNAPSTNAERILIRRIPSSLITRSHQIC